MGLLGGDSSSPTKSGTVSVPVTASDYATNVANGSVKQDGRVNLSFGASSSNSGTGNGKASSGGGGGKGGVTVTTLDSGAVTQAGSYGQANNAGLIIGAARGNKDSNITYNFTDGGIATQALAALKETQAASSAQIAQQISAQNSTLATASKSVVDSAAGGLKNYAGFIIVGLLLLAGFVVSLLSPKKAS